QIPNLGGAAMKRRIGRRTTLSWLRGIGLAGTTAAVSIPGLRRARAQALDRVSFLSNWRAQAEHGGYYQAVANGIYRRHGIDCDLRQGGPQVNNSQILLNGRVDF